MFEAATIGTWPFWIAMAVLAGLLVVEIFSMLVGASVSNLIEHGFDFDADVGGVGAWLSWLNAGGVPVLIYLCIWLALFAIAGFAIQGVAEEFGGTIPTALAALGAVAAATPSARLCSQGLGRLIPREETSAVDLDDLIGTLGTVSLGPLDQGKPGRVRVMDQHGNYHELRARSAEGVVLAGAKILVVDRNQADGTFIAVPEPDEIARIQQVLGS